RLAPGSRRIRGWESFEPLPLGGGRVALRSVENGRFVRAGMGRGSHLAAMSGRVGVWEAFRFVEPAGGARPGRLDLEDLAGDYRITHLVADSGYLVQLARLLAGQARLSIDGEGMVRATVGCNRMNLRISVAN